MTYNSWTNRYCALCQGEIRSDLSQKVLHLRPYNDETVVSSSWYRAHSVQSTEVKLQSRPTESGLETK
eukprot:44301-Eustigmatos_ZCMA.PRE.1